MSPAHHPPLDPTARELALPDGPTVWCTSVPATTAMWREMRPPGTYHRAVERLGGGTVVDVGANVGLLSLLCARRRPGLVVVAAEPVPELYACLTRNLAAHVGEWRAEQVAVGATGGELPFTYYPQAPGNSGLYADAAADDAITRTYLLNTGLDPEDAAELTEGVHRGIGYSVRVVTVSELIERHRIDRVALLKVDVERAELDVLRGVEPRHWPRIDAVVAEVHDERDRLAACVELLRSRGFTVTVTQDPLLADTVLYDLEAVRL
ncbi:FkbM family methyltransferase [Kitasatospora sp. NPDC056651]|uniref:FkbM family methyltransferase n=1 Tax=Kitasatospora sp. NPDC056651 TaxID=3345892 RepID=UPI0036CE30B3